MVNRFFYIFILVFILSCTSKKKLCFNKAHNFNKELFAKLIDTNCFYIKKYKIDINDESSLYIQESNALLKKIKPFIRFLSNGKFEYYYDINSFNLRKPIYGNYKFRNDTIEACREYYSAQSGRYYSTTFFIFKDSIIEEIAFSVDNGTRTIYQKKCK
jgi:hypothetical protein